MSKTVKEALIEPLKKISKKVKGPPAYELSVEDCKALQQIAMAYQYMVTTEKWSVASGAKTAALEAQNELLKQMHAERINTQSDDTAITYQTVGVGELGGLTLSAPKSFAGRHYQFEKLSDEEWLKIGTKQIKTLLDNISNNAELDNLPRGKDGAIPFKTRKLTTDKRWVEMVQGQGLAEELIKRKEQEITSLEREQKATHTTSDRKKHCKNEIVLARKAIKDSQALIKKFEKAKGNIPARQTWLKNAIELDKLQAEINKQQLILKALPKGHMDAAPTVVPATGSAEPTASATDPVYQYIGYPQAIADSDLEAVYHGRFVSDHTAADPAAGVDLDAAGTLISDVYLQLQEKYKQKAQAIEDESKKENKDVHQDIKQRRNFARGNKENQRVTTRPHTQAGKDHRSVLIKEKDTLTANKNLVEASYAALKDVQGILRNEHVNPTRMRNMRYGLSDPMAQLAADEQRATGRIEDYDKDQQHDRKLRLEAAVAGVSDGDIEKIYGIDSNQPGVAQRVDLAALKTMHAWFQEADSFTRNTLSKEERSGLVLGSLRSAAVNLRNSVASAEKKEFLDGVHVNAYKNASFLLANEIYLDHIIGAYDKKLKPLETAKETALKEYRESLGPTVSEQDKIKNLDALLKNGLKNRAQSLNAEAYIQTVRDSTHSDVEKALLEADNACQEVSEERAKYEARRAFTLKQLTTVSDAAKVAALEKKREDTKSLTAAALSGGVSGTNDLDEAIDAAQKRYDEFIAEAKTIVSTEDISSRQEVTPHGNTSFNYNKATGVFLFDKTKTLYGNEGSALHDFADNVANVMATLILQHGSIKLTGGTVARGVKADSEQDIQMFLLTQALGEAAGVPVRNASNFSDARLAKGKAEHQPQIDAYIKSPTGQEAIKNLKGLKGHYDAVKHLRKEAKGRLGELGLEPAKPAVEHSDAKPVDAKPASVSPPTEEQKNQTHETAAYESVGGATASTSAEHESSQYQSLSPGSSPGSSSV